jgi:hypothetical protein
MGSILAAVQVIISSNNQPLPPTSAAWSNFTQHTIGGFQIVVLYLAAGAHAGRQVPVRDRGQHGGGTPVRRPSRSVDDTRSGPVRDSCRSGRRHLHIAERAVARLRANAPATSVRRGLPGLNSAPSRTVQRVGNAACNLRAGHRRARPPAGLRR